MALKHYLDLQNSLTVEVGYLPDVAQFEHWVNASLSELVDCSEMTICLVDEKTIQKLNETYRQKNTATNVLSFSADIPDEVGLFLLGDVVICASVVKNEAVVQNKRLEAHWAHMVVHGCLHLLAYDHVIDADAEVMEAKEIEILRQFGYANPYRTKEDDALKQ